jgi:hypothetical protein
MVSYCNQINGIVFSKTIPDFLIMISGLRNCYLNIVIDNPFTKSEARITRYSLDFLSEEHVIISFSVIRMWQVFLNSCYNSHERLPRTDACAACILAIFRLMRTYIADVDDCVRGPFRYTSRGLSVSPHHSYLTLPPIPALIGMPGIGIETPMKLKNVHREPKFISDHLKFSQSETTIFSVPFASFEMKRLSSLWGLSQRNEVGVKCNILQLTNSALFFRSTGLFPVSVWPPSEMSSCVYLLILIDM